MDALRSILSADLKLPKCNGDTSTIRTLLRAFEDLEQRYPQEDFASEDLEALEAIASF
jgi:hypothetical protein